MKQMTTLMPLFAVIAVTANISFSKEAEKEPLAWIQFTRYDRNVALYNGFYMYYVGGVEKLEFDVHVDPHAKHKLAFMWICKDGPPRSMKIVVNGKEKVVTHNALGNGKQSYFWDTIPVTEFGITERKEGTYRIVISYPEEAQDDAILGGIRLITDDKQLETLNLKTGSRKTTFVSPGTLSEEERLKTRVDRAAARERAIKSWVGQTALSQAEIQKDEFLAAAVRFADTIVRYGRDQYGPKKTPLFVNSLHRETLRAPAGLTSLRPDQGGSTCPIVPTQFDRNQNLLRLLTSLSLMTGDKKYTEAALEATIYMFDEYSFPNSGLIVFGNHMTIDLISGRSYSDGRVGEILELEDVFPFYDFFYDVAPEKTSRFVKGLWEAYVRDWHTMHYNRHTTFNKRADFAGTWNRPMREVTDLPSQMNVLGFIDVGLDLAFAGYTLGCLEKDERPRRWANRFLEVIAHHRDPKTKIWPMLIYTPPLRRGLEAYVRAYPDSNPTEPRVIISSWIYNMPIFFLGTLGTLEQASKYGHEKEVESIQRKVDQWILGYMNAAYDRDAHKMRSILLDGRDVTDHVFREDATLRGWGAAPNGSFVHHDVYPVFHAAVARAYRLSRSRETREEYWDLLRDLFVGADLGDIGENSEATPSFNYQTQTPEQAYVFALADIYRVTRNPETLKFMEHLGRNIIRRRQDPKTGLFSLEPERGYSFRHLKEFKEPHEGLSVKEFLRSNSGGISLDYDRPKVVSVDVNEPHALLAIYGCRTGQFDKIPLWISGGQWGRGSTSGGHAIDKPMEVWFNRKKLKQYYQSREAYFKERGFVITDEWYPNE